METVNERIGRRIRELRREKGMTQTDFGKLFHYSQNDITNIERGKKEISFSALLEIAEYYNVPTDFLLKKKGQEATIPTYSLFVIIRV